MSLWKISETLTLFVSRPLSAFWSPLAEYPHYCIDEGAYMLSFGIITIFLDFFLLLLPVPIVWTLQLSKKQRTAVCALFFLGFVVCIAGVVQVWYIDVALISSYDETWDGWPLWVASAIEVDVGIVSTLSHQAPRNSLTDDSSVFQCLLFDLCWPSISHDCWNLHDPL